MYRKRITYSKKTSPGFAANILRMGNFAPIFTVAAVFVAWSLLSSELQRSAKLYFVAFVIGCLILGTAYSLFTTGHIPHTATFSDPP